MGAGSSFCFGRGAGASAIFRFWFRVPGSAFRVPRFAFRVSGFGFRVPRSAFRVPGFGFRGWEFALREVAGERWRRKGTAAPSLQAAGRGPTSGLARRVNTDRESGVETPHSRGCIGVARGCRKTEATEGDGGTFPTPLCGGPVRKLWCAWQA